MLKAAQNISLEKASQSTFEKAIKNFKELMKVKRIKKNTLYLS